MATKEQKKRHRSIVVYNSVKRTGAVTFSFRFSKSQDPDLIEKLESVPNKRQYIRRLIKDDIAKNGK